MPDFGMQESESERDILDFEMHESESERYARFWNALSTKAKQEMPETETKMDSESESKAHPDSGYPDSAKLDEM